MDAEQWVTDLNAWCSSQVTEWAARPHWEGRPFVSSCDEYDATKRGGNALIRYGTLGQVLIASDCC